jgi:hypothetical protein
MMTPQEKLERNALQQTVCDLRMENLNLIAQNVTREKQRLAQEEVAIQAEIAAQEAQPEPKVE